MNHALEDAQPTRWFRRIAIAALLWNLIGIASFMATVMVTPEALKAMPEAQRVLYTHTPVWVTASYAVAVLGATLGSVLLLARKAWTVPVFAVSLAAIVLQMGYSLFGTPMIALLGPSSAVLPLVVVAVAAWLLWFSLSCKRKGWLR